MVVVFTRANRGGSAQHATRATGDKTRYDLSGRRHDQLNHRDLEVAGEKTEDAVRNWLVPGVRGLRDARIHDGAALLVRNETEVFLRHAALIPRALPLACLFEHLSSHLLHRFFERAIRHRQMLKQGSSIW